MRVFPITVGAWTVLHILHSNCPYLLVITDQTRARTIKVRQFNPLANGTPPCASMSINLSALSSSNFDPQAQIINLSVNADTIYTNS